VLATPTTGTTREGFTCIMIGVRILDHVDELRSLDPDNPAYQVTFWGRSTHSTDRPEAELPFEAEIVQLADVDVREVLEWADAHVGEGRTYQVAVATSDQDTVTNLILLCGRSPVSSAPQDPPDWFGNDAVRLG